ncbi:MAG: BolA/IbaG family iron-sulfur metabolism protein [Pseudomonadales bacterium]|nr:BolA/IbaG family iron-sulfur metabolism protein [Pseudomonadales bacterium]NRA18661.1 BolA/IbaG family iron-sulfur metabolism protein [Oceanospirillaceae bacterium]
MQAEEVQHIIESQIPEASVITAGEGCNFEVTVVSDVFSGLMPVKRQQLVYQCVNQQIADGSIHALTIKTYTPAQWQKLQD